MFGSRLSLAALAVAVGLVCACAGSSNTTWQAEDRLEATDGQIWVVGSQLVTVSSDATVVGKPAVGATVRISGQRTSQGELVADSVEVTSAPQASTPSQVSTPKPSQPAPVPVEREKKGRGGEGGHGGHD